MIHFVMRFDRTTRSVGAHRLAREPDLFEGAGHRRCAGTAGDARLHQRHDRSAQGGDDHFTPTSSGLSEALSRYSRCGDVRTVLSFLPLSHIAERMISEVCLNCSLAARRGSHGASALWAKDLREVSSNGLLRCTADLGEAPRGDLRQAEWGLGIAADNCRALCTAEHAPFTATRKRSEPRSLQKDQYSYTQGTRHDCRRD